MKFKVYIILSILLISCSKEEIIEDIPKLFYEYNPIQPKTITVEVVPTENTQLEFQDMLEEVNADYYNRYGIAVNFILKDREQLSDDVKYYNQILIPQSKNENILLYIIPEEYMYFDAYGYSVINYKSIVLREDSQTTRTLAHEIGHILNLKHIELENNVMTPYNGAKQFDIPNDFVEKQIDTIMVSLNNHNLSSKIQNISKEEPIIVF